MNDEMLEKIVNLILIGVAGYSVGQLLSVGIYAAALWWMSKKR